MKIYPFGPQSGREIKEYGSAQALLTKIAHLDALATVSCMYMGEKGLVGDHQATSPQLFLVMHGEGWVRGESEEKIPIRAGLAACWEKDEPHAAGTESGMMVMVIEADSIRPIGRPIF